MNWAIRRKPNLENLDAKSQCNVKTPAVGFFKMFLWEGDSRPLFPSWIGEMEGSLFLRKRMTLLWQSTKVALFRREENSIQKETLPLLGSVSGKENNNIIVV